MAAPATAASRSNMNINMNMLLLLIIIAICAAASPIRAADEDPLQDFCIADYSIPPSLNGFACKPTEQVKSSDFKSSLLQSPGPFEKNLGLAINLVGAARAPGLNTMGLSLGRLNFQPKGVNPPHAHPRGNELFYLAQGTLIVGLVTTNNTLFQETLHPGDFFVFPRGLLHFQINPHEHEPALAFASFNSQNPGVLRLPAALFASNPSLIPSQVLQTAFALDEDEVNNIHASVATTLLIKPPSSVHACMSQCASNY